jgi:O-antigen/teichoic acid export membrane protein
MFKAHYDRFLVTVYLSIRTRIAGSLARNTLWAIGGYVARLLLQAVYFVLIARCLGPVEYGGFIAVAAMASMVSPFVSLGSGSVLMKNVSRDRGKFAECWGNCLVMTVVSGVIFVVVSVAVSALWLPRSISLVMIAMICTADLIFVRLLDMAAWAFQAIEKLDMNARLNVLISFTRLSGVVVLVFFLRRPTVLDWSCVYLASAVVSAICGLVWVKSKLGAPSLKLSKVFSEWKDGLYFAISNSASTIYNDIDKTMVARLSTLEATGIYGAAYRMIDVAFIPVRALLNAAYPVFFRKGLNGIHGSLRYGRMLFLKTLPYALFVAVALFLGAPIVPHILGGNYSSVSEALRWLCPLPLLKTFQFFIADALTGAGYQRGRSVAQVFVAIFNIVLNLWAIPAYGWRGAAWASLASDGLLALILWLMAYYLSCTVPSVEESTATVAFTQIEQRA